MEPLVILATAEENNMFVHIGSVLCPGVRRPCFGVVLPVLFGTWEILIAQVHHTTICWQDGELLTLFGPSYS